MVWTVRSRSLEVIYLDKSRIADASSAKFGWPEAGTPEATVFYQGDKYITDDAYENLADLGVTKLGGGSSGKNIAETLSRTRL